MKYAIRSDLHARTHIAERHERQFERGEFDGIFDLGDIEAPQIGPEHPLRKGQFPGERTIDVMLRNGRQDPELVEETITDILAVMPEMRAHERRLASYRAIAGNGKESWLLFAEHLAPGHYDRLANEFDAFAAMRSADAECIGEGTCALYLPWKAPVDSVHSAVEDLASYRPGRIVILSHDYLTEESLDDHSMRERPATGNEEQARIALDGATQIAQQIVGYFGHVGMSLGPWKKTFNYRGKPMTAYHADERSGEPLILDV